MFQQTTLLYAACFLMDAAAAGMSFAVARRAAELGATAPELGLLGAIWIGVYAVSALVLSRQAERWGRRQVAALACGWTTKLPLINMPELYPGRCPALLEHVFESYDGDSLDTTAA